PEELKYVVETFNSQDKIHTNDRELIAFFVPDGSVQHINNVVIREIDSDGNLIVIDVQNGDVIAADTILRFEKV
ncbi:hypothetical protein, partial [Gluconobacter kondonii]|uniref:hypothetical protein n=1 Tax=Gluconobacter kondonii TaxID=941463 RepID=UPI0022309588